jgi:hypothetical protein
MKKLLLSFSLLSSLVVSAQTPCSELFISEYVEGSGNNKALELYNPTGSSINLTGYRLERFSNGDGTSAAGGVLNLSGSIAPYTTFVIVNGVGVTSTATGSSPAADTALQAMADLLDNPYPAPTFMNGNDAIALFKNTTMIDLMGKINDPGMVSGQSWSDAFPYDGSAGAWWTKDQTLIRKPGVKSGVTVNPDPFIVTAEWDSLPKNTWSQLGNHTCDCFVGIKELNSNVSFVLYPNPSSNGIFTISANNNIEGIVITNTIGQVVLKEEFSNISSNQTINATTLPKGIYSIVIRLKNNALAYSSLTIN